MSIAMIVKFVIFLLLTIVFAWFLWWIREESLPFLFPVLLLRKDLPVNNKLLPIKLLIIASIIMKILIFISCFIFQSRIESLEDFIMFVIITIICEWAIVSIVKIIILASDIFIKACDGMYLIFASAWVLVGIGSLKSSWLYLILVLFVLFNLSVTLKYMVMLCLKRGAYIRKEFGKITTANQLAAVALLISVQIYNFVMLIYLLIHLGCGYLLYDSNKNAVTKVFDIIYYVIISYTSVGYGDIAPQGTVAQIVAIMISATGFFMSVAVIGIILSTTINKKSNKKRNGLSKAV